MSLVERRLRSVLCASGERRCWSKHIVLPITDCPFRKRKVTGLEDVARAFREVALLDPDRANVGRVLSHLRHRHLTTILSLSEMSQWQRGAIVAAVEVALGGLLFLNFT